MKACWCPAALQNLNDPAVLNSICDPVEDIRAQPSVCTAAAEMEQEDVIHSAGFLLLRHLSKRQPDPTNRLLPTRTRVPIMMNSLSN